MVDNSLDKVPGAFEQRMGKRRRMFKAIGVELSENPNFQDIQDAFPQSVINCYSCESDDVCLTWLDTNEAAKNTSRLLSKPRINFGTFETGQITNINRVVQLISFFVFSLNMTSKATVWLALHVTGKQLPMCLPRASDHA